MNSSQPERADWQGVGASFRTLGRRLKGHATEAGGAISAAGREQAGAVDQISAAFTTAVAKLDETTTDPEVANATREATARLLDAIKQELTGIGPDSGSPAEAPDDPEPPSSLEPGPTV